MLPLPQVESEGLPVQDLTLQPVHCSQDLYRSHKAHPAPISKDGYNSIFTHQGLVFDTLSLPQDKVLTIKAQATKVASSFTCLGVMRLLGPTDFDSLTLPLTRLNSHPLKYLLKEIYKTPGNQFKGLKPDPDASQTLH